MKVIHKLLLLTILVALATYTAFVFKMQFEFFITALLILAYLTKENRNLFVLTSIFILISIVEYIIYSSYIRFLIDGYTPIISNTIIYLFLICFDTIKLYLVKNRWELTLKFINTASKENSIRVGEIGPSKADKPIAFVLLCNIIFSFLVLIENTFRNIDKLGIDESFASHFYDLVFFYHALPIIRAISPGLLCAILVGAYILHRRDINKIKETRFTNT